MVIRETQEPAEHPCKTWGQLEKQMTLSVGKDVGKLGTSGTARGLLRALIARAIWQFWVEATVVTKPSPGGVLNRDPQTPTETHKRTCLILSVTARN